MRGLQRRPTGRARRSPLLDETRAGHRSRTAYQIVSMLEGVVQRGTGLTRRGSVGKPVAGKTGTVE